MKFAQTSLTLWVFLVAGSPVALRGQSMALFAAAPDRGATDLRPIVGVVRTAEATRYVELRLTPNTRAVQTGRWLGFLGAGTRDSIRVTGTYVTQGCSETRHGRATLPQGVSGSHWVGVAGDVPGLSAAGARAPTTEEMDALTETARRQARRLGIRERDLPGLQWLTVSVARLPSGDTVLAATWKLYHPALDSVTGEELGYSKDGSGHIVLEGGPGRWHRSLDWARDNEESGERRKWVVLIDLDGDAIPEMVTSTFYYESDDYQVYERSPRGWRVAWRGSMEGC